MPKKICEICAICGLKMEGFSNYIVITARKKSFQNPIILKKGVQVTVGEEYQDDPEWPGWIWCESPSGKVGWVPKQYIHATGDTGVALCAYSANELTVKVGEELIGYKRVNNGWVWCKNSSQEFGWVPVRNLEQA